MFSIWTDCVVDRSRSRDGGDTSGGYSNPQHNDSDCPRLTPAQARGRIHTNGGHNSHNRGSRASTRYPSESNSLSWGSTRKCLTSSPTYLDGIARCAAYTPEKPVCTQHQGTGAASGGTSNVGLCGRQCSVGCDHSLVYWRTPVGCSGKGHSWCPCGLVYGRHRWLLRSA